MKKFESMAESLAALGHQRVMLTQHLPPRGERASRPSVRNDRLTATENTKYTAHVIE
jgi:hypothetical protein